MTYNISNTRTVHLVAGDALPKEVLISYKDDDEQTKLAVRGLWQTIHIYSRCWLQTEPLEHGSELYKCRFSSSRDVLSSKDASAKEGQAFLYLLPRGQVLSILNAPIRPIEWQIVADEDGDYPVNVAGWNTDLWQSDTKEESKAPDAPSAQKRGEHAASSAKPSERATKRESSQEKVKDLAAYKERKVEDPIATYYEQITLETIDDAIEALYPGLLATGAQPERKDLPLILIQAMRFTLAQNLERERDPRQIKLLEQHIEDMDLMMEKCHLWRRDRERYVTVLWTDELCGVCAVNVGIHPRLRVKARKEAPRRISRRCSRKHAS